MRISESNESKVVHSACLWICSTFSKLGERLSLSLIKHEDHARADIHSLEKVALRLSLWEAFHDPPVDSAVALLQPLLHERVNDRVRDRSSGGICLRDYLTDVWVLVDHLLEELLGGDSDQSVFLSKLLGLSCSSRAWGSLNNDFWCSSRGLFAESDFQHADEVGVNFFLLHKRGIDFKEEVLKDLFNSEAVEIVLLMDILDGRLEVLALQIWVHLQQVLLDFHGRFID
jgi:hypothetical protein